MNITVNQLNELGACQDGVAWFKTQNNHEAKHVLRECTKTDNSSYANWYVTKLFTKPQAVEYSIYCAELCIAEYEKDYPNDPRPREAIEAAKAWLENPNKENKVAAESAAESAARYAARYAILSAAEYAWSAADSARSAARYATWSAARYAADSARYAAWSAAAAAASAEYAADSARSARYAAVSAAKYAAWEKIVEKAIKILGL